MVTEYGRSDRRDKAEGSTIPELFELLYTAQNFQDQLRGMPKSDLRDSNILQDLRRFAELDMAEKMTINSRSYSANMDIAQTQAVQFNDTTQNVNGVTNTAVNPLTISDKTKAFGVTVDPKLEQNYKQWLVDHPNGIVAYRINYKNFNTAENVNKNIIGNPFDWQKYGQEKSLQMFYEWLTTGVNYNEALATDEYRNAIINKLLSIDKPEVLYYKELGHPSYATVIGYLIEHKELLQPQSQESTSVTSSTTQTMEVRDELRKASVNIPSSKPQGNKSYNNIAISTGYTKGEPEDNPNTDYVFTENAEVERSKKVSYEGYGGVDTKTNTSVDTNSQSGTEDSKPKTGETKTDENSKPVQQIKLTAGQEAAKKAILNFISTVDPSTGEYFTLTGKAGTGKTTLIQEVIREIAKENPYQRFVVSALAHKAVQVIYDKTKNSSKFVSASTVASLLGMKLDQETGLFKSTGKNAKIKLKRNSILFVDEASMLNEQNIKCLMDAAIRTDSKVIFLGDPGQLPPIRTGDLVKYGTDSLSPVFKTQKDEYSAGLTERVRQGEGSPILDYADTFWNYSTTEGQTDRRVNDEDMSRVENAQGSIEFINEQQADKIVPLFKQAVETNNPSLIKVVAYHNNTVKQWNQIIRRKVYGDEYSPNPLPGDILMMTDTYNDPASDNAKPLLFNSEDISVISTGPIRTVYRVQLMDATVKDPRGKIITVPLIIPTKENMDEFNNNKRLLWNEAQKYKNTDRGKYKKALDTYWNYGAEWAHVEYGYAITSHKSQGSTYDVSIVDSADINSNGFMSDISKARSIYTAITRARNSAVILRDKLSTLDVDLKQLNDRINGYKDGSVTPPAQITPDTVDNVGNTYKENIETLESDKTILSNEEILKLRPFTGNDKAPRIAVASEHTDPVFFAKKIKEFFEGKTSVQPRFGQPITAKDIDALYIITKHDGLPLRDILSIKIPKIIHFSITGLGGTKYEPGVMPYNELLDRIGDYIKQGLDPSMVTVRIDPIVPGVTPKHVIEDIIKRASSMGIKNIRFSIMDFYATTAQFTETNGFDYSKYYVPQTNADGSQRVLLVSRDGRSFSRIDGVSYRQVGKSIAVLQSYGAESKVYLQGKSGNVWVKTVQTSNITDDVIKSKDGWTVLNDKQVMNDQVASRVKAGVHLQKLYETHAKQSVIKSIANIVKEYGDKYGVRLSTCAEPDILPSGISHEGCLSVQAINDILHTNIEDKHRDNNKSRSLCECYGGKTDILKYNDKCASSCAYCYAHHNSNAAATMYNPDGSLKHNALTTTRRDTEEFDATDIDDKFILHCKGK